MHLSAIDVPSDKYGAVTDVSRPLLYKLNQASMNNGTYDALHSLLTWALAQMNDNIAVSLEAHNVSEALPSLEQSILAENELSESRQEAQTHVEEGDSEPEVEKSIVGPETVTVKDAAPLEANADLGTGDDDTETTEVPAPTPEDTVQEIAARIAKPK